MTDKPRAERTSAENLLERYVRKPSETGHANGSTDSASADGEGAEDFGCFGFLRGVRDRALMLELRKKDGSTLAIAYAFIERIAYNPDAPEDGITIHAAGQKIRIVGRNLDSATPAGVRLFGAIVRHRVPWIAESTQSASIASASGAVTVESILP